MSNSDCMPDWTQMLTDEDLALAEEQLEKDTYQLHTASTDWATAFYGTMLSQIYDNHHEELKSVYRGHLLKKWQKRAKGHSEDDYEYKAYQELKAFTDNYKTFMMTNTIMHIISVHLNYFIDKGLIPKERISSHINHISEGVINILCNCKEQHDPEKVIHVTKDKDGGLRIGNIDNVPEDIKNELIAALSGSPLDDPRIKNSKTLKEAFRELEEKNLIPKSKRRKK